MDVLRTLTSALGHYDPEAGTIRRRRNYRKAVRLTAQSAAWSRRYGRLQAGGGPIEPDPALGHAANFLYMLTGERPSALATRAFDIALVLHADHELNASTFAARVAAATLTDSIRRSSAIGALKGPLHGGANADVMRMLLEIGADAPPRRSTRPSAASWRRKRRFPGFGHRVYHTEDPRATHLRRMSKELGEQAGKTRGSRCRSASKRWSRARKAEPERRFLLGVDVLHARHPDRSVHADFRGQPRLGLDGARASSSTRNNRLIRPRADYIGPPYPQR